MGRFEKMLSGSKLATPSRRGFLKMVGGAAGAGLMIGFVPLGDGVLAADNDRFFTPFVKLQADGRVIVIVKHLDKGQGVATGLATLVAEELDASPNQVGVEFAPADARYNNLFWGVQGTGGSSSIANSFEQYRQAGAAARAVLVKAAARRWGVAESAVSVKAGLVAAAGKTAKFADLLADAQDADLPAKPTLKAPKDWVYIGKAFPRVDAGFKSHGAEGRYAMDFQPEGYVAAAMVRPPRFGAKLVSFDATEARAVKGVVDILQIGDKIAVLAESTWPAFKAKGLITAKWDFSAAENRGTDELMATYKAAAAKDGRRVETRGDVAAAFAGADRVEELEYEFPYLAHAAMEPLDATVQFDGKKATVWTGSQIPTIDQGITAGILGLEPKDVTIVTQWAGGSFGRRAVGDSDFVAEAALIAKAWGKGRPVKLVWTREDDMTGGRYRPMYVHKARLAFAKDGSMLGWQHHLVGQSIVKGTPFEGLVKDGVDATMLEGLMHTTYELPAFALDVTEQTVGVPPLWWRSVGHTHTGFVTETVIELAARRAGADPVEYRRKHMKDDPRKLGVLKLVAEKAGWGKALKAGRYRGVAVHESFGSFVAQVVEISMTDGQVKVEKVWCAVDCGIPVNPDVIRAQMEGGIGFGLGAVLRNEITLTDGEVDQTNFDTYMPIRMEDMPDIEVHIMPSELAPTGVGEPGVPPVGPALANAILAATGKLPTKLPLSKAGLYT